MEEWNFILSLLICFQAFQEWNDSFRVALLKKHISFTFDYSSDVDYRTIADIEKMERIYFNLFSNAIKYTLKMV
jgi:signal transduction histidine kinase